MSTYARNNNNNKMHMQVAEFLQNSWPWFVQVAEDDILVGFYMFLNFKFKFCKWI